MDRRMKYVFAGLMVALLIAMCISSIMPALAESTYSLLRYVKDKCDEIIAKIGLATDATTADTLFGRLNWIKDQFTTYWTTTRAGYLDILNTDAKYLVTNALPGTEASGSIGKLVKELRTVITDTRAAKLDAVAQVVAEKGIAGTAIDTSAEAKNLGAVKHVWLTALVLDDDTPGYTITIWVSNDGTTWYGMPRTSAESANTRFAEAFEFDAQYFYVTISGATVEYVNYVAISS